jgi:hypothetical protein
MRMSSVLAGCLAMAACGGGGDSGATLESVQQVFNGSCAGTICHVGFSDQPAGELDLSPGNSCASLVGVPSVEVPTIMRVTKGASSQSYLMCKLEGCADLPAGASTMPLAGDPLSADTISMLAQWIDDGAPGCDSADSTAPTFAGATSASGLPSAIEVSWSPATDDVTPAAQIVYLIYEADTSGGQSFATPTFVTAPGATSFRVQSLPLSTTRFYVVRARDAAGNIDGNTAEVSATTPATGDETPPTFAGATSATGISSTSLQVSWNAATDDVSPASSITYRVYLATSSGAQTFSAPSLTTDAGATSALVTGLDPSTTYFAVVRAVDASGNEDSNATEVSAATTGPVSFSADVQPIFTANCTAMGCHSFPMPQEGMDLRAGQAYGNTVNVASAQCTSRLRVAPGDPDNSYLVNKIEGVNLCFGAKMPKVGSLSQGEIQIIRDWVAQGALDN